MSETKAAFAERTKRSLKNIPLSLHGRQWRQVLSQNVSIFHGPDFLKTLFDRLDTTIYQEFHFCPLCTESHYENIKTQD